jgi:hypothetical protein
VARGRQAGRGGAMIRTRTSGHKARR